MIETICTEDAADYGQFYAALYDLGQCSQATVSAYDLDKGYVLVSFGDDYDRKVDREVIAKLAASLEISLHKSAEQPCFCGCDCDCESESEATEEKAFRETICDLKAFLKRIEDDMK